VPGRVHDGEPAEALLAGEVPGDVVQDPLRSKRLAVDRVDELAQQGRFGDQPGGDR